MQILQTNQLTKHFGPIKAVNALDLTIEKGQIFGILGPNGSGKTTTLGMVLDITRPTSGHYQWFEGAKGRNARRSIGSLLETPNFYPYLNADENLEIVAHIRKISTPRLDALLELVDLKHRRKSQFKTYSLGMKQRLAIAAAMVGDPEVLILDEPTNGLDPQGIAEVRQTIIQIAEQGKTIIMASHILAEVEKVCSHVGIIKNGTLLATGTVGSILDANITVEVGSAQMDQLVVLLSQLPDVQITGRSGGLVTFSAPEDFDTGQLNQLAFNNGIVLTHLLAQKQSLEDEFLKITSN